MMVRLPLFYEIGGAEPETARCGLFSRSGAHATSVASGKRRRHHQDQCKDAVIGHPTTGELLKYFRLSFLSIFSTRSLVGCKSAARCVSPGSWSRAMAERVCYMGWALVLRLPVRMSGCYGRYDLRYRIPLCRVPHQPVQDECRVGCGMFPGAKQIELPRRVERFDRNRL